MKNFVIIISAIFLIVPSVSLAQNLDVELLLKQRPELRELIDGQSGGRQQNRALTAGSQQRGGLQQKIDAIAVSEEPSVLENYYKVLTGSKLSLFGHDIFAVKPDENLVYFNQIDPNYLLGPGDELKIVTRGLDSGDRSVIVDRNGYVVVTNLPPLLVSGQTVAEFEASLQKLLQDTDASASVFVSVENTRLLPVQITGASRSPGTMPIAAYTPLSIALGYAGGISKVGSLRKITLIGPDKSAQDVDLYGLLNGDPNANDPVIVGNSRVFVHDIGSTFAVAGFVSRNGIFEMLAGEKSISLSDALASANVPLLPLGAQIELRDLGPDGSVRSTLVEPTSEVRLENGDALLVKFIETQDVSQVRVLGAVQKEFSLDYSPSLTVSRLIKNGAVLNREAVREFALIQGRTTRAINLRHAIDNPGEYLLEPGDELIVITSEEYEALIRARQDQLVSQRGGADEDKKEDVLQSRRQIGEARIAGSGASQASHIEVLERRKAQEVAKRNRGLERLVNASLVSTIFVDGEPVALIAPRDGLTIYQAIDDHIFLPIDTVFEFAITAQTKFGGNARSFNLQKALLSPNAFLLPTGHDIHVFTQQTYAQLVKRKVTVDSDTPVDSLLRIIDLARPATLYYDGKRIAYLVPGSGVSESENVRNFAANNDVYPLYASVETFNEKTLVRGRRNIRPTRLLSNASETLRLGVGARVDLVSGGFVFLELNKNEETQEKKEAKLDNFVGKQSLAAVGDTDRSGGELSPFLAAGTLDAENQKLLKSLAEDENLESTDLNFLSDLQEVTRVVNGAVGRPGRYPVSGGVTLAELLDISGGILQNGDPRRVQVAYFGSGADGVLKIVRKQTIDLKRVRASSIKLKGQFEVTVPRLINDAITGRVSISGEVKYPGVYTISRGETIADVVKRAGGFTRVAYPLGAVFARASLIPIQREGNEILAQQIEKSVVSLSQSDRRNAGDQINAVLGYAGQLRRAKVIGRQTVNLAGPQGRQSILMKDGDKLNIPLRPSHVSVLGSVYNPTLAAYEPGKSVKSYILDAGGLDRQADRRRVYIVLPNGQAQVTGYRDDATVVIPPGATVVIPPNTSKLSALRLTDVIARIIGNVATSVLAVNSINR